MAQASSRQPTKAHTRLRKGRVSGNRTCGLDWFARSGPSEPHPSPWRPEIMRPSQTGVTARQGAQSHGSTVAAGDYDSRAAEELTRSDFSPPLQQAEGGGLNFRGPRSPVKGRRGPKLGSLGPRTAQQGTQDTNKESPKRRSAGNRATPLVGAPTGRGAKSRAYLPTSRDRAAGLPKRRTAESLQPRLPGRTGQSLRAEAVHCPG